MCLSLRDCCEAYARVLRIRAKDSTIQMFCIQQRFLEEFFEPGFNVAELTAGHLNSFIEARLRKVSRASVNNALRQLSAALHYAVEAGLLDKLPLRVKLLRTDRKLPRVFSPEEIEQVIAAAEPPFDTIILIAAHAGLRHQEILHLQVKDVDFTQRMLRVSSKPDWNPKDFEERAIPMSERLTTSLKNHVSGLCDQSPQAWVFPSPQEEHGLRVNVHYPINSAFKLAGLYDPARKPGLHSLRRSWATELTGRGADVETVRQLGGWSDLKTVMKYITSNDQRKRAAIDLLD